MPTGQPQLTSYVSIDGGANAGTDARGPLLPLRRWVRLAFSYDVSSGAAVLVNGAVVGTDTAVQRAAPGTTTKFISGMSYQLAPGGDVAQYEIDNLVFRGL
jgi:hypothetical protein